MSPAVRTAQSEASAVLQPRSLPLQLIGLVREPLRAFPAAFERRNALALIAFPAISGVYVAYAVAAGIGLGDRIGFTPAATLVLFGGAMLGTIALWFAGSLPYWSRPDWGDAEDEDERGHMFIVFGYATWPFLPLLAILAPVELLLYGESVFAGTRPAATPFLVWGLRALQLVAILLWLAMMLKGTAFVRHESTRSAARELVRWGSELVAIGVLFALILMASMMYW